MPSKMKYKIAVFPGDGVGPELVNEGVKVIEKAAELGKFEIEWIKCPYGYEHYSETKEFLPEKALKEIKDLCNAIYCGTFELANGKSISAKIKAYFGQFVSLRPVKLLPNVESPLNGKTSDDINFTLIRESSEDFYVNAAGMAKNGRNKHKLDIGNGAFKAKFNLGIETQNEIAYHIGVLSRKGCERIARYAFEYAKKNSKTKIVAVDKANMIESYNLWRESFDKISKEYDGIEKEFSLVDAAIVNLLRQPEKYELIVAPNMFGGILSDIGTVLQGGLSFAARGSINPDGISMFEPVHGSAQKLKGKGIVNPIATIWAGALMLDTLGQHKSSQLIIKAVEAVLKEGRTRTIDLGGNNSTSEMGDSILDKFVELHD